MCVYQNLYVQVNSKWVFDGGLVYLIFFGWQKQKFFLAVNQKVRIRLNFNWKSSFFISN